MVMKLTILDVHGGKKTGTRIDLSFDDEFNISIGAFIGMEAGLLVGRLRFLADQIEKRGGGTQYAMCVEDLNGKALEVYEKQLKKSKAAIALRGEK